MDYSIIEGMESVVATVSGYHGSERFSLIKLISQSGANYVGAMSESITHLVCRKFEGRKYELAKKFDTVVVNHQWVEECVRHGKRVPEYPYMLESGQEVGPLVLEVPNVDKSLDPDDGKDNSSSYQSKLKKAKKIAKQENCSSSRYCFQDPLFSGQNRDPSSKSSRNKESSIQSKLHSVGASKNAFRDTGITSFAEPSRKDPRLVKKNVGIDKLETVLSDSDQEWHPVRLGRNNNNKSTSKHTVNKRVINILEAEGTSDTVLNNIGGPADEALDDIEEDGHWNHLLVSKYPNSFPEGALAASERAKGSAVENLKVKVKDVDQYESVVRSRTSVELSCVICWTESSSTRGILPCGHRFCYSCIQEWADHMASRRKTSTCPLCKASFSFITKVEDAATSDQKIYSQTIPCASSAVDIFVIDQEPNRFGAEPSFFEPVCCECRGREPEDLLVSCHLCQIRCIHSYCLDPPLSPWICTHCKDLQMLYHHSR